MGNLERQREKLLKELAGHLEMQRHHEFQAGVLRPPRDNPGTAVAKFRAALHAENAAERIEKARGVAVSLEVIERALKLSEEIHGWKKRTFLPTARSRANRDVRQAISKNPGLTDKFLAKWSERLNTSARE